MTSNLEIIEQNIKSIYPNYEIVYIPGHYVSLGKDANIMKNPIWKLKNDNLEFLIMYCEKDTLCKLCHISYQKIIDFETDLNNGKKITWFKSANGYISGTSKLYIHQIITGCYGNGRGTKNISVDHIDRNPKNNIFDNLRIATRDEQEQNSKGIKPGTKRERKQSAKPLPYGITQDMMKKYVVYYHEWLNVEKSKSREFFKIEKHPKLNKMWIGTKSNKISISDKLLQANNMIVELDN